MNIRFNSFFFASILLANLVNASPSDGEEEFFDCEESELTAEEFSDPSNLLLPPEFFNKDNFTLLYDAPPSFQSAEQSLMEVTYNSKFGHTFRCNTSYARLAAQLVQLNASSAPIMVGDWGCGLGFTSAFLLFAGNGNAFIKMLDPVKEHAQKANTTMHKIAQKYLGNNYVKYSKGESNPSFSVSVGGAENPPKTFRDRRNHLNIAFNIMHMMTPEQCDAFLAQLFENTEKGGIAMIVVSGLPPDQQVVDVYQERERCGERYPGFGVYNISLIGANRSSIGHMLPSYVVTSRVSLDPKLTIEAKFLTVGTTWVGRYGDIDWSDDGYVDDGYVNDIEQRGPRNPFGALAKEREWKSYCFQHKHFYQNLFTVETLTRRMTEAGFRVISSFFVNKNDSEFYATSQGSHHDVQTFWNKQDCILVIAEKNQE